MEKRMAVVTDGGNPARHRLPPPSTTITGEDVRPYGDHRVTFGGGDTVLQNTVLLCRCSLHRARPRCRLIFTRHRVIFHHFHFSSFTISPPPHTPHRRAATIHFHYFIFLHAAFIFTDVPFAFTSSLSSALHYFSSFSSAAPPFLLPLLLSLPLAALRVDTVRCSFHARRGALMIIFHFRRHDAGSTFKAARTLRRHALTATSTTRCRDSLRVLPRLPFDDAARAPARCWLRCAPA